MKKRSMIMVFMVTLLLLGCQTMYVPPESVGRNDFDTVKESLTELIEIQMAKFNIKGVGITLVNDQEVLWTEGFGDADKAAGIPATEQTAFYVGSISKVFTAICIMQLVEEGKIDLDAPLEEYIPGFTIKSRFKDNKPITVRSMLTHHSGLPSDILMDWQTLGEAPEGYETKMMELPGLVAKEYRAFHRDEIFAYSNAAYSLLGVVVSNVSGIPFHKYVKMKLLMPLNMKSSSFLPTEVSGHLTKGYHGDKEVPAIYIRDIAAGLLAVTPADMGNFMKMLFNGGSFKGRQIIKQSTLEEMISPQNEDVPLDRDFRIGLAFWLNSFGLKGEKLISHSGGISTHSALFIGDVENRVGVCVMVNSAVPDFMEGSTRIALEAVKLMREAKAGLKYSAPSLPGKAAIEESLAAEAEGLYSSSMMGTVKIKPAGKELTLNMAGQDLVLVPREGNTYSIEFRLFGLFTIDIPLFQSLKISHFRDRGELYFYVNMADFYPVVLEKIVPVELSSVWAARLGKYRVISSSDEDAMLGSEVELKYDHTEKLFTAELNVFGQKYQMPLIPASDRFVYIAGKGRNSGSCIEFSLLDGADSFYYSGYTYKKAE